MKRFLLLLPILILLVSCRVGTDELEHTYFGRDLTIGVVGAIPTIKEKNIDFESIALDDFSNYQGKLSHLDAIIIMKEYLNEADDDQYVDFYQNLPIPVFFMQSTKAHVPFVNEGVHYDDFPDVDTSIYAVGFLRMEEAGELKEQAWRYKLRNNVMNESTVHEVYSQIFHTIESVKSN